MVAAQVAQAPSPAALQLWGDMSIRGMLEALVEVARDDSARGPCRRIVEFCATRWDVPLICLVLYLGMVRLAAKRPLPKSWANSSVDAAFAAWNLGLALFSTWGCVQQVAWLGEAVPAKGFYFTVCSDPFTFKTEGTSKAALSLFLFAFSKIPELGDTAFLILRGKPVRFLQWYHHSSVLLFCWLAVATEYTPGTWFSATNYSVHSVMYTYFFLMHFQSLRGFVKRVAPCVTVIQIAQMVFGLFINGFAVYNYAAGNYCHIQPVAVYSAVVMYASYFVLFSHLFIESRRGKKVRGEAATPLVPTKSSAQANSAGEQQR